jgi:thermostable 8-oxoguanine DNA glycosylase
MLGTTIIGQLDKSRLDEYHRYWGPLTVTNHADYFRRWLFAFCSVHTTWESNVRGYEAIKDFTQWLGDREALRAKLLWARCGVQNNRARFITQFAEQFWTNPDWFYPRASEPWQHLRDRLEPHILGLGLAKTSFALEMAFPTVATVACLDVHMLRLYGETAAVKPQTYAKLEANWLEGAYDRGVAPYMARMVYWDNLQGKDSSRYWSHCLEKP